jgi:hypothetical protein
MSRRSVAAVASAVLLLAAGQYVGAHGRDQRDAWPALVDLPYAPTPEAAPFVTLGYRELAADLFWLRSKTYFGGTDDTAAGLRGLVEAVLALDPAFTKPYDWAPRAISVVDGGTSQEDQRWAAAIAERGLLREPASWRLLKLAGEIYLVELESDDPAQRAAWQDRGATLLEQAIRQPGAPRNLGVLVAHIRSGLGQRERAVADLQELILTTSDRAARQRLVDKLAELEKGSSQALADELQWEYERLERERKKNHPELPPTLYILLGPRPPDYLDLPAMAAPPALFGDAEVFEAVTDP